MKFRFLAAMLCVTTAALLAVSCSDDEDCPDCPGTGAQPVISAMTATPEIVDQGGEVAVEVTAQGSGNTYAWSASGGTFSNASAAATTWTAPAAPGVHLLTVTVTGSNSLTAVKSKAVGVEMGLELNASATSVVIGNKILFTAEAVGSGLNYDWTATDGTFSKIKADSAWWKAPDTVPTTMPAIQVVVASSSGQASRETMTITVDDYTPTAEPHYKGALSCTRACHATYDQWSQSAHAGALESLRAIGMHENPACVSCHTVGSMGVDANEELDNGGFDETPIAKLAGVQCENCHGPAGDHPASGLLPSSLDAALCGGCHTDAHHPTYDEWQTSGHGAEPLEDAAGRGACVKCHNGAYSYRYLNNPAGFANPADDTITEHLSITCAVCHDPHGSDEPGSLREAAATDVVLPDATVIAQAGAGRLCMACHNGRRTPTNIDAMIADGSAHFGPHHSVQGDMLAGTGAYEEVMPEGTLWASSMHLQIQDGCVSCHTHSHEGDPENGTPNYTGHDFQPTVEACRNCHGEMDEFEDVRSDDDYDGDGVIEGVQLEIDGLAAQLKQAITEASDTPEHEAALAADFEGSFNVFPDPITTVEQRKAAYNYFFVEFDQSRGVHNAKYSVQLLQRSIALLQPLPRRMVLLES